MSQSKTDAKLKTIWNKRAPDTFVWEGTSRFCPLPVEGVTVRKEERRSMTGEQRQWKSCVCLLLSKLHFGLLSIIRPAFFSGFVKLTREIPLPQRIISWRTHSLVCANLFLFFRSAIQLFSVANYYVDHIYYPWHFLSVFLLFSLHRQDKATLAILAGIRSRGLISKCFMPLAH